jgi:hypothetical protein
MENLIKNLIWSSFGILPFFAFYLGQAYNVVQYFAFCFFIQLVLNRKRRLVTRIPNRLFSASHPIQFSKSWKCVFPLSFQVEATGFECVCLLFNRLFNHFPEAFTHSKTQVARGYLVRQQDSISNKLVRFRDGNESKFGLSHFKSLDWEKKRSS